MLLRHPSWRQRAKSVMEVVSMGLVGTRTLFRALGKRPSPLEREAWTAERLGLLIPTRIAIAVEAMVLVYFPIWR